MAHKPKQTAKHKRSRTVLIIVGVLVLAVVAGAIVQVVQKKIADDKTAQEKQNEQFINGGPPLPKTVTQSSKLAAQGKGVQAQQQLQQQIDTTTDNSEKFELYIQQGLNYMNQKDYTNAINSLQKADAIKSDFRINALLGDVYVLQGNKVAAKEHYTKAISLIDPESSGKDAEKRRMENKIRSLGV